MSPDPAFSLGGGAGSAAEPVVLRRTGPNGCQSLSAAPAGISVIEPLGLEGTLKVGWFQPPAVGRGATR